MIETPPPPSSRLRARFIRVSLWASRSTIAVGVLVLVGWTFDLQLLKSLHPSFAAMTPNAALLFVLLGWGLSSSTQGNEPAAPETTAPATTTRTRLQRALAIAVIAVAAASAAEHLFDTDLGIDQLLYRAPAAFGHVPAPGRMAPVVALDFLLLGLALLARRPDAPDAAWARAAVSLAGLSSFVALTGYSFSVQALYAVGSFASIALHTALGFLLASAAFLAARPNTGLLAVATSRSAAGVLLRRVLPLASLGILTLGWLQLWGGQFRPYDIAFRIALLTVGDVLLLALVLSAAAARLRRADVELGASEERFRLMVEAIQTGLLVTDTTGRILMVNAQIEQLFGYSREELIGSPVEMLLPSGIRGRHAAQRQAMAAQPGTGAKRGGRELWARRKDGSEVPIEIGLTTLKVSEGEIVLSSVVDTTERKRAERERQGSLLRKKAAERLRERSRFFELSIDMVCIANTKGHFVQVNPAFSRNLGYSTEELLQTPIVDFIHPDDRERTIQEFAKLARGQPTLDFSNRYVCKNGSHRWFQWRATSEGDGSIYAVARDVTRDRELLEALQSQQASLSASLKEREVLLQEVHHRVKNNLQVIASLINLQLLKLKDHEARNALEECRMRIETIALIHEKLYQAHDYARIPFSEYVKNLAGYIQRANGASQSITLQTDPDELLLPVDRAIPCALILNELITNSLKHAFPDARQGNIRIELRSSHGHVQLAVADDGVGVPEDFDPRKYSSLGMQLVTTLNEQLDGHLEIVRGAGTTFRIEFAVEEPA